MAAQLFTKERWMAADMGGVLSEGPAWKLCGSAGCYNWLSMNLLIPHCVASFCYFSQLFSFYHLLFLPLTVAIKIVQTLIHDVLFEQFGKPKLFGVEGRTTFCDLESPLSSN